MTLLSDDDMFSGYAVRSLRTGLSSIVNYLIFRNHKLISAFYVIVINMVPALIKLNFFLGHSVFVSLFFRASDDLMVSVATKLQRRDKATNPAKMAGSKVHFRSRGSTRVSEYVRVPESTLLLRQNNECMIMLPGIMHCFLFWRSISTI